MTDTAVVATMFLLVAKSPGLTWCQLSAGVSEPLRGANPIQCADGTNVLSITESGFFSLLGAISCPLM